MTPHSLTDQSFQDLMTITTACAGQIEALDPEARSIVGEAIVKMIVDFVAYANAFKHGHIADLLIKSPNLMVLGEVLLDGKGNGVIMMFDSLKLWFTFEEPGIVLQDVKRAYQS